MKIQRNQKFRNHGSFEPARGWLALVGLLTLCMGAAILLAAFRIIELRSNTPDWILLVLGLVVIVSGLHVMFYGYHHGPPDSWYRKLLYYTTFPVVVIGFTLIVNWIAFFATVDTFKEALVIGWMKIPLGAVDEWSHRIMFGLGAVVMDLIWLRGLYWHFFQRGKGDPHDT
jgi:hypothetical protein